MVLPFTNFAAWRKLLNSPAYQYFSFPSIKYDKIDLMLDVVAKDV
jgi:hypothetical protein